MFEIAAAMFGVLALIGLAMVISATLAKITVHVQGRGDNGLHDPWMRRNDPLTRAFHWFRPGVALLVVSGAVALLLEGLA